MAADPLDFLDEGNSSSDPLSFLDKPERGTLEKTARTAGQYGLGYIDRALSFYSIPSQLFNSKGARTIQAQKGIRRTFEKLSDLKQKGNLNEEGEKKLQVLQNLIENPDSYKDEIQSIDRTPSGLVKQGIQKLTGYDLEPEGGIEKTANFLGSYSPKEIIKGAQAIPKVAKSLTSKTKELFPSGLSKPRAIESKLTSISLIGKETQKKAIEKLNKEAGHLAKSKVHEQMPITKQIEQGFDFKGFFSKRLGHLEKVAESSKARIDLTPVEELLEKTAAKYRGVPNPHQDAKKIALEIKAFYKKPPSTLPKALKTYRSNNQKLNQIYETSRLTGTQKEYADFLVSQNKAIAQSFRDSLGKDSKWVNEFERLNAAFKQHINATKTLKELDGFFGGRLTPRSLEKLGNDPRTQQKLSMMMGQQGASEIGQLAKDLKSATEAIKGIPKTQYHKYEAAFPLTFLIPVLGKYLGGIAAQKVGRSLLGFYLSKAATRRAYSDALKALKGSNLEGYRTATAILKKSMENPEED
jgi:hypothetical protein